MVTIKVDKGYYIFKLSEKLQEKNISINQLVTDTGTDFKVIKRYMNGDIVKMDIYVLDRLCNYFQCEVSDIIEYKRIG